MANFAPLKNVTRSFENARNWLIAHGFEVIPSASGGNVYKVAKDQCVAEIEVAKDGNSRIAPSGCLVAGEPAILLDRGYQKFLRQQD